jgi:FKBP-type peptidyl-prolyl cis-trans isomerase
MEKKQQAESQKMAEVNQKAGEAFLAENAKRPEVKTTVTGLQYEILSDGNGAQPTANDQVEVHYTGKLIDGTVFDSSVERGVPATFGVTQVIPGWVEALQLMKAGSKWRLYIPSNLAYGPNGAGGVIGPNATLIFDVELLKVVGK